MTVEPDDRADLSHEYQAILRFVRRTGASPEDAEDITQTTFAEAHRGGPRDADGATPIAWLYTVARRRAIDRLRRDSRHTELARQLPEPTPGDDVYGAQVQGALTRALAKLPHEQREVVVRRLIHDVPFTEIARELDTSEAACKMRFQRGLATVRESLAKEGLEP